MGKTSLIKQAVAEVRDKASGFYTEEIRSRGLRQSFRLITLESQSTILPHVNVHNPCRVSKYGVDINNLDQVGVAALYKVTEEYD